jgi:hypothetical protein
MFVIDITYNGCQGRSNRSSIVHAVSYFACGANDTACIFKKLEYLREYEFKFEKALAP